MKVRRVDINPHARTVVFRSITRLAVFSTKLLYAVAYVRRRRSPERTAVSLSLSHEPSRRCVYGNATSHFGSRCRPSARLESRTVYQRSSPAIDRTAVLYHMAPFKHKHKGEKNSCLTQELVRVAILFIWMAKIGICDHGYGQSTATS